MEKVGDAKGGGGRPGEGWVGEFMTASRTGSKAGIGRSTLDPSCVCESSGDGVVSKKEYRSVASTADNRRATALRPPVSVLLSDHVLIFLSSSP